MSRTRDFKNILVDDGSDLADVNNLLEGAYFNIDYCEVANCDEYEAEAVFQLNHEGGYLYLRIYNSHNGYYSHGFEFGSDKGIIKRDSL